MIYLDQAATSLHRPKEVEEAMIGALRSMGNASRGIHQPSLASSRIIYETREQLARLFHASSADRVAFTSNATEALNLVIESLITPPCHVIATAIDHNSALRPLYRKEEQGVDVTIVPADRDGRISYEFLEQSIRNDTRAVVVTHASNVTGNLTDIGRIGRILNKKKVLFILDAAQTAGVFPIDMEKDHIGAVCFTGHKGLMGPQGTGGVCVGADIHIKPVKTGGSGFQSQTKAHPDLMPEALEAGTLNGHGIAGLNAGLSYIRRVGMEYIRLREQSLMERFYDGIRNMDGIKIYGSFSGADRAPVLSFNIRDMDSGSVCDALWQNYKIACRGGLHCAYLSHMAIGTGVQGTVRISASHFNTELEIDMAAEAVRKLAV